MTFPEAVVQLLLRRPFFGSIAVALAPRSTSEVVRAEIRLHPAPVFFYNLEWFESLPESQARGVLVHELLHLLFLHPWRRGNRDPLLWAVACDLAVNEHLNPEERFPGAVTVEAVAQDLGRPVPRFWGAEAYFDWLDALEEGLTCIGGEGEVKLVLRQGGVLTVSGPQQAEAAGDESDLRSLAAEVTDGSWGTGEETPELVSKLTEVLGTPSVGWRNVLKRFLTARGTMRPTKTYKRESKRFADAPGSRRTRGLRVLLALDESGSIAPTQRALFLREVQAIRRITRAQTFACRFDTTCSEPLPLTAFLRNSGQVKGGGTDFHPVFDRAEAGMFPLLVIFTDGEGPAPETSDQRVLWVLCRRGRPPAPYGDAVWFEE